MIEDLIILGAGGSSREIAGVVEDINRQNRRWNLCGFLDDDPAKHNTTIEEVQVLGPIASARQYNARFIAGVAKFGDPDRRKRVVEKSGIDHERFATIIHPSALVSRHVRLGYGTVVMHNTVITGTCDIGNHVLVHYNASIAHDSIVEDFVTMAPGAIVSGSVRLCQGAYLGAGSTIMNGLKVSAGALVGIGAVVVTEVAPGITMLGNPARQFSSQR
jgi:sugar O-acyltransferase (sialic acid O-acetyltransferase NeuD family)